MFQSPGEKDRIAAALAADPGLAAQYRALCRDLDLLAGADDVDVPLHVVQRMHESIDRVARPVLIDTGPAQTAFNPLSFIWGAAVTAALAIGIGIGVYSVDESKPLPLPYADPFMRGMQVYLQDARDGIAALPSTGTDDRTRLILNIIEQNRLYERAAEQIVGFLSLKISISLNNL